jgi:glycosyltransferase involved in cell wall biosynthesis
MRITVFSNVFYPEHFLINSFVQSSASEGHSIEVLTGLPNYPHGRFFEGYGLWRGPYREAYAGAQIIRTPILARGQGFLGLIGNYMSFLVSASISILRLKRSEVSFVFGSSPITVAVPAILAKIFRGTPVVLWLQDLWPESLSAVTSLKESSLPYRGTKLLVHWIYRHCDLILIQSPAFQEHLQKFSVPEQKIVYVPNWAEDNLNWVESPQWLSTLPRKFTFTYAGNMGLAQGLDNILRVAERTQDLKDVQWLFVGEGRDRERLQKMALNKNLENIFFVGSKPFADMKALFEFSDVLLVSLKKEPVFQQTIPAKIQQYLAAGKPILSLAGGVSTQVLSEAQAGFGLEPGDLDGFEASVRRLHSLPKSELEKLSNSGKAYAEVNFSKSKTIRKILELLSKVVDHGAKKV